MPLSDEVRQAKLGQAMQQIAAQAMDSAMLDVLAECDRQRELGFTADHDDQHSTAGWIVLLTRYLGKTGDAAEVEDAHAYRHRLVQITAIGLASIRSLDRAVNNG